MNNRVLYIFLVMRNYSGFNNLFHKIFKSSGLGIFSFPILVFLFGLNACNTIDPPLNIPAYIQVDSFSFSTADSTGFNTQKISDVWIFVNGQQIGTYSVPTKPIPVLAEGNATVSILAGVYADGVLSNRIYYPFYGEYKQTMVFGKGKVTKVIPRFAFESSLKIPFTYYQDFETSDSGFSKGTKGTVELKRLNHLNADSYPSLGNRYGSLTTTSDEDLIEFSNSILVPLNETGMPVYVEFDYKSTCEIQVGLKGAKPNSPVLSTYDLVLKPRDVWTKIYVNLTDEIASLSQEKNLKYRFFLTTFNPPGAGNSLSIDNIRLLQFPK